MKQKYKLIQDNDCHWYVIPATLVNEFYEWVEAEENYKKCKYDFSDHRIDGPHRLSFENPIYEE